MTFRTPQPKQHNDGLAGFTGLEGTARRLFTVSTGADPTYMSHLVTQNLTSQTIVHAYNFLSSKSRHDASQMGTSATTSVLEERW